MEEVVTPDPATGAIKQTELPLNVLRKAAQFLEEMRGSPMTPGWEDARLGELVRQLYRPDVEGVAYYEFKVINPDGSDKGFIILSTGDHDFPVPHWNHEGETPSENVERVAAESGKKVAKFFKLDTLAYAGEDADGNLAAMPGTQMVKIKGLTESMLDDTPENDVGWTPNKETKDDADAGDIDGTKTETGPTDSPMQVEPWESWQALKDGFKDSYGVMAESLRRAAAEDWEIDQLAEQFGEGLYKGETYFFSLLHEEAPQVSFSGEGSDAKYVETEIVTQAGLPTRLRITVKDAIPGKELPLNVMINYSNVAVVAANAAPAAQTTQETLKFALLDAESLPKKDDTFGTNDASIYLPMITHQRGFQAAAVDAPQAVNGSWSNWTYHWAGTHGNQRLYDQIPKSHSINTSSCWSGCGGTAWAMLFGWADKQADLGNAYWAPRWGLYRQNGGKGGNAVAPRNMDNGVRNMTWEIRNDIGTWCAGNSGPTFPWDMDQATDYLKGRTGTKLSTHYNVVGIHESRLRKYARNSIRDRNTPAIIGTGWLTHYPLAYGYAWRKRTVRKCFIFCWNETQYNRSFYVNQGWGGSGNGWVSAGTWFAGEIRP